ncbi:MAG: hypothetical protein LUC43_07860 [Burkholderiales bacterium]|nr:hypothetical protein [Burkholderiales bacterium]
MLPYSESISTIGKGCHEKQSVNKDAYKQSRKYGCIHARLKLADEQV